MDRPRRELARLINERGDDYASLSRLLGRNAAYIQQFIKRGIPRKLDEEDRRTLARYFGVSDGLLGGPPPLPGKAALIQIDALDVCASAGPGAIAEVESRHARFGFEENWLRNLTHSKPQSLSIIRVMGDSMEPTLSDGDDVLVDTSDSVARLRDGIYVLRHDDTVIVKRIAIAPGRRLTILSDNPAYPRWDDVDPRTLSIVGRLLWIGRKLQ